MQQHFSKKLSGIIFAAIFILASIQTLSDQTNLKTTGDISINSPGEEQNIITLMPHITYQTISGWEGCDFVGVPQFCPSFPIYVDELCDKIVNEAGLNRIRLEIRPSQEHIESRWPQFLKGEFPRYHREFGYTSINDDNDPDNINWDGFNFSELDWKIDNYILKLKSLVEANGEQLYINLCFVGFDPPGPLVHRDNPAEYAELILAVFLHLQSKYGFVPDALEVELEPANAIMNGTQLGKCLVAAGDKLAAHGFHPDFIAPSDPGIDSSIALYDDMIKVPRALDYLTDFCYHRYWGGGRGLSDLVSRAVRDGKRTAMLEYWGHDNYQVLHDDLKNGLNSAWQQGSLRGIYDVDETDPKNPVVKINGVTKYTMLYYKYVRSGAIRVEAKSNNKNFDPIAFINKNGSYTVVTKASSGGSFSIGGLPEGTYSIRYTTSPSEYNISKPDVAIAVGQSLSTDIPAPGVITVFEAHKWNQKGSN